MTVSIHFNQLDQCSISFSAELFTHYVLKELNLSQGHYEFTFVNDQTMIELHQTYLQKNSSTDILTFNYNTESEPEGDIYICIEEAKRNAHNYKHSFDDEIKLLMIHGILHLIGYSDYDEESKKIMFDEQDRLLEKERNSHESC